MGPQSHPNLIVEAGPFHGEAIEPTLQELIIGRDTGADQVVPSPVFLRLDPAVMFTLFYQQTEELRDLDLAYSKEMWLGGLNGGASR